MAASSDEEFRQSVTRQLIRAAIGSLLLSMTFLLIGEVAIGGLDSGNDWGLAISMMVSRTFGIASFLCGAALLLLEQWTIGTLTLLAAIILPCISFLLFGTI